MVLGRTPLPETDCCGRFGCTTLVMAAELPAAAPLLFWKYLG
jgi:hypothetical protein